MEMLFRCYNCDPVGGKLFQSRVNTCPACKLSGDDPKVGGMIAPCVVIHFDPPHPIVKNRGLNIIACQPGKKVGEDGLRATGDPREVLCPACKVTKAWKDLSEWMAVPPAYRVPLVPVPEPAEEPAPEPAA